MDMYKVLETIAVPRPNHSDALEKTSAYIQGLLASWDIPFTVQEFVLRPYQQLLVGYACFFLSLLVILFVVRRKPLPILIAAIGIGALLFMEFEYFIPLVSPLITKTGQNIIVSFPAADAVRELVFAAHYDSKTDFFDHIERAKLYRFIPIAGVLGMLMSLWVLLRKKFASLGKPALSIATVFLAGALSVYWGLVALGFGGYIFLSGQSCGAVDDGGSVVTLLALAKDIKEGRVKTGKSAVTIVFFAGEEVGPQGSRHFVKKYFGEDAAKRTVPASLVNLELVGQNGNMLYWRKNGIFLSFLATDAGLRERLDAAWKGVSGKTMDAAGHITDDALHFLRAGVPAITVGHTGLPGLGEGGFHDVTDCMDRVNTDNLYLMRTTLAKYIEGY
ncbi:MAG TPA: M20/M25/M40 family metallo-hydrolase [Spirochaetota bacterium]|nr:M20/M25/M40 family metallo-hydrolase [Spirochaetota bacterium]